MSEKKIFLADVGVLRLFFIFLLVFCHAFAVFNGTWETPEGFPRNDFYWWIVTCSSSFIMEVFVFMSGYLLGYQVKIKGEKILMARQMIGKKAYRLMLPCIVFGLLYFALFYDYVTPWNLLYTVLNGTGHLWFLPMLFWCFVAVYFMERFRIPKKVVFPLLVLLNVFAFIPLPLRMTSTMRFLLFFYVGYTIYRYDYNLTRWFCSKYVIISMIGFVVLFVPLTLLKENFPIEVLSGGGVIINKVLRLMVMNVCTLLYASAGLAMAYISVNWLLRKGIIVLSSKGRQMSDLCFGVYIYQQFVMLLLYYNLNWIDTIPPLWLPWFGFITAVPLSLLLSYLTLNTRWGRCLIG